MSMTVIEHIEVGSGGAAEIVLDEIPDTFTDLYLVMSLRSDSSSNDYDSLLYRLNASTSGYSGRILRGQGTSVESGTRSTDTSADATGTWGSLSWDGVNNVNTTANAFTSINFYLPNYRSSVAKSISYEESEAWNSSTRARNLIGAYLHTGTDPITSVAFALRTGSFVQYSTVSLFGVLAGSDGTTTVS